MGCASSSTKARGFSQVVPEEGQVTERHQAKTGTTESSQSTVLPSESWKQTRKKILFEISANDQLDLDVSKLKSYKSFEWPTEPPPLNRPMPPARQEHEENLSQVLRFSQAVTRFPRAFRVLLRRARQSANAE